MFYNLTSINFLLVSVRQTRLGRGTGAHGVCCRVQIKPKVRLNSGTFRVVLPLLVCAPSKIGLLVLMEAIVHPKTLRSDFHPYSYPL